MNSEFSGRRPYRDRCRRTTRTVLLDACSIFSVAGPVVFLYVESLGLPMGSDLSCSRRSGLAGRVSSQFLPYICYNHRCPHGRS